MMEASAAIALTCNSIELARIAASVYHNCKSIHDGSHETAALDKQLQDLIALDEDIKQSLRSGPGGIDPADVELYQHCQSLHRDAAGLIEDLSEYVSPEGAPPPSRWRSLAKGVKYIIRQKRLLENVERLRKAEDQRDRRLLFRVSKQATALGLAFDVENKKTDQVLDDLRIIQDQIAKLTIESEKREKLHKQREAQQAVLSSLWFPEIFSRHGDIAKAHSKTFRWIFDRPNANVPWDSFSAWLTGGSTTEPYWINGKAGSGKSTLVRYIEQHSRLKPTLEGITPSKNVVIFSYYFWLADQKPLQKSIRGMLRALLYQILQTSIDTVEIIYEMPFLSPDWTIPTLKAHIKKAMAHFAQSHVTLFIIDGLDECDDEPIILKENLDFLKSLPSAKLLASSRPLRTFAVYFETAKQLRLQDLTRDDIRKYVADRFKEVSSLTSYLATDDIWSLQERIPSLADGVFLWVKLVIDSLIRAFEDQETAPELVALLENLPRDLRGMFERMMLDMDDRHKEKVFQHFRLMEAAHDVSEQLTMVELAAIDLTREASSYINIEELTAEKLLDHRKQVRNFLETKSCGLLESRPSKGGVDSSEGVRFTHRSAFEFTMDYIQTSNDKFVTSARKYDPYRALAAAHIAMLRLTFDAFPILVAVSGRRTPKAMLYFQRLKVSDPAYCLSQFEALQSAGAAIMNKLSLHQPDANLLPWIPIAHYFSRKHRTGKRLKWKSVGFLNDPIALLTDPGFCTWGMPGFFVDLTGAAAYFCLEDVVEASLPSLDRYTTTYMAFSALLSFAKSSGATPRPETSRSFERQQARISLFELLLTRGASLDLTWSEVVSSRSAFIASNDYARRVSNMTLWDFFVFELIERSSALDPAKDKYSDVRTETMYHDLLKLFLSHGADLDALNTSTTIDLPPQQARRRLTITVAANLTYLACRKSATDRSWGAVARTLWDHKPSLAVRMTGVGGSVVGNYTTLHLKEAALLEQGIEHIEATANLAGSSTCPYMPASAAVDAFIEEAEDFAQVFCYLEEEVVSHLNETGVASEGNVRNEVAEWRQVELEYEGTKWILNEHTARPPEPFEIMGIDEDGLV